MFFSCLRILCFRVQFNFFCQKIFCVFEDNAYKEKCVFSKSLRKHRKMPIRKQDIIQDSVTEMSLMGHRIQIWNHLGLDHKREITLHSDFTLFIYLFLCWEVV